MNLKKGDSVFLCIIGNETEDYASIAFRAVTDAGLIPFLYSNVVSFKKTNIESDFRNDFYNSKFVVVVILGKQGRIEDEILFELNKAISNGISCYIFSITELKKISGLELPIEPILIKNEQQLGFMLKKILIS